MSMNKRAAARRNTVRIIGGTLRSRRLSFPDAAGLRPTPDRIRETLFNWLRDSVVDENCLDLFAGSGALGFEALSRGARQVVFVEINRLTSEAVTENLDALGVSNADLYCMDAMLWIDQQRDSDSQFGIVFLDPPFTDNIVYRVCDRLQKSNRLKLGCKIYVESAVNLNDSEMPSNWSLIKSKKAGLVNFYLYSYR